MSENKEVFDFEVVSYRNESKKNRLFVIIIAVSALVIVSAVSVTAMFHYNEMNKRIVERNDYEFVIDPMTGIELLAKREMLTPSYKASIFKNTVTTYFEYMYGFNSMSYERDMTRALKLAPKAGQEQFYAWEDQRILDKMINEDLRFYAVVKDIQGSDSSMHHYKGVMITEVSYVKPLGQTVWEYIYSFEVQEVGRSEELISGAQVVDIRLEQKNKL